MEDRSHFLCSFGGLGSTEDMQPVFFFFFGSVDRE